MPSGIAKIALFPYNFQSTLEKDFMEINVSKLLGRETGETLDVDLEEEVAIPDKNTTVVQGKLKLTRLDQSILASFDITVGINLNCDKCLESFRHQMPLTFDREYLINKAGDDEGGENLRVDDNKIDTTLALIHEISINLPIQSVCKPDCKGLDPKTGEDLNQQDSSE